MNPTREERERFADYIVGTCKSIEEAAKYLELTHIQDWEDHLLSENVELCQGCQWWHESAELDEDTLLCYQCHESTLEE